MQYVLDCLENGYYIKHTILYGHLTLMSIEHQSHWIICIINSFVTIRGQ